jgi:hypothetical protein
MRRNFGEGALRLLGPTTSTGYGLPASIKPVTQITAQASGGGVGSFVVEGSLNAVTWFTVIAASTFPVTGRTVTATSTHVVTNLRASFTLNSSTTPSSLFVAGR